MRRRRARLDPEPAREGNVATGSKRAFDQANLRRVGYSTDIRLGAPQIGLKRDRRGQSRRVHGVVKRDRCIDDVLVLDVKHQDMHAGAIARGMVNGFGDLERIASGLGGIEAVPDLRGVDGDMDVEFPFALEDRPPRALGDVLYDEIAQPLASIRRGRTAIHGSSALHAERQRKRRPLRLWGPQQSGRRVPRRHPVAASLPSRSATARA